MVSLNKDMLLSDIIKIMYNNKDIIKYDIKRKREYRLKGVGDPPKMFMTSSVLINLLESKFNVDLSIYKKEIEGMFSKTISEFEYDNIKQVGGDGSIISNFELLPDELRLQIMSDLKPGEIKNICSTNKYIQVFCNENKNAIKRGFVSKYFSTASKDKMYVIYDLVEKYDPYLKGSYELIVHASLLFLGVSFVNIFIKQMEKKEKFNWDKFYKIFDKIVCDKMKKGYVPLYKLEERLSDGSIIQKDILEIDDLVEYTKEKINNESRFRFITPFENLSFDKYFTQAPEEVQDVVDDLLNEPIIVCAQMSGFKDNLIQMDKYINFKNNISYIGRFDFNDKKYIRGSGLKTLVSTISNISPIVNTDIETINPPRSIDVGDMTRYIITGVHRRNNPEMLIYYLSEFEKQKDILKKRIRERLDENSEMLEELKKVYEGIYWSLLNELKSKGVYDKYKDIIDKIIQRKPKDIEQQEDKIIELIKSGDLESLKKMSKVLSSQKDWFTPQRIVHFAILNKETFPDIYKYLSENKYLRDIFQRMDLDSFKSFYMLVPYEDSELELEDSESEEISEDSLIEAIKDGDINKTIELLEFGEEQGTPFFRDIPIYINHAGLNYNMVEELVNYSIDHDYFIGMDSIEDELLSEINNREIRNFVKDILEDRGYNVEQYGGKKNKVKKSAKKSKKRRNKKKGRSP